MTTNPWIEAHIEVEIEFQEGDHRTARALVMNEYTGAPQPIPCPCGGTLFYKATIGARKCPDCGQLANAGRGDLIGGRKF